MSQEWKKELEGLRAIRGTLTSLLSALQVMENNTEQISLTTNSILEVNHLWAQLLENLVTTTKAISDRH